MAERLTDQRVRTAKPKARRYSISDSKEAGLELRIHPDGRRVFALRRGIGGKDVRLTIGEYGAEPPRYSLERAREAARALKTRLDRDGDFRDVERAQREAERERRAFTVGDLIDAWLADMAGRVRASTLAGYTQTIETHIRPAFGSRSLVDVTRADVRDLVRGIAQRGSGVAANKVLARLNGLYKFARADLERDVPNPAQDVRAPHKERARERVLSDEAIRVLINGLDDPTLPPGPQTALALKLALYSGQRIGEVIGMQDSELDFGERVWLVPGERTKSGRPNSVPITARLAAMIRGAQALRKDDGAVFSSPSTDAPITRRAVSRAMRKVCTAIETRRRLAFVGGGGDPKQYQPLLDGFTVHDLRRTARTLLSRERLGIRPEIAEKVLSHLTGAAIERVYDQHAYLGEKRTALEKLGAELDRIVNGRPADHADNVVAMAR